MSLLTVEKRRTYFKKLGLGEYNKENIKKKLNLCIGFLLMK